MSVMKYSGMLSVTALEKLHDGDKDETSEENVKPSIYWVDGNAGENAEKELLNRVNGSKITLKGSSVMEAPFSKLANLSAQPPNHSGKMKLQCFSVDESIQKVQHSFSRRNIIIIGSLLWLLERRCPQLCSI